MTTQPDRLAPPLDLAAWLGVTAAEGSATGDRHALALEVATGWVQDYTSQRLILTTNDAVTLPLYNRPKLWLPERPVISVASVSTTTAYGVTTVRTAGVDYTVVAHKICWLRVLAPVQAVTATVVYTHGYAVAPQGVRGVVLSAAARVVDNPDGNRSETVGGVSWTVGGTMLDGAAGLSGSEKAALASYRVFPGSG